MDDTLMTVTDVDGRERLAYNWHKAFNFDADVTMVVSARTLGKTFGLRRQFIRDWLKHGWRFVEVCRFNDERKETAASYFDKLGMLPECEGWVFRTTQYDAYIARKPEDGGKPEWQRIGYFVSLTQVQLNKKRTFSNVRRICMDEAIIDRKDKYHKYLTDEWSLLANIVDTASRESPDSGATPPRVYLLGNAVDLINPYFAHYGIDRAPAYGKRWYAGKTFLLDNVDSGSYAEAKTTGTVAGRMLAGTVDGDVAASNVFAGLNAEYVAARPKHCRFVFGLVFEHTRYGVWRCGSDGLYYVDGRIPGNTRQPVFSLTREDDTLDRMVALRSDPWLRQFARMYTVGAMRFVSVVVMVGFMRVLDLLGVK